MFLQRMNHIRNPWFATSLHRLFKIKYNYILRNKTEADRHEEYMIWHRNNGEEVKTNDKIVEITMPLNDMGYVIPLITKHSGKLYIPNQIHELTGKEGEEITLFEIHTKGTHEWV